MTLYVFVPDDAGPSTCEGDCLAAWPALAGPATAGDGVDAALLGTAPGPTTAPSRPPTTAGRCTTSPRTSAPGDVNGQGVGDIWYVVDPSGG